MAANPIVPREFWNVGVPVADNDGSRAIIPERFEMEKLDGISFVDVDEGLVAG